jgi:biotin-dependent carboxylase-like uncharacterized protein
VREAAKILDPGTLTLIEDAGRIGYAHLGVPRAGAFDPGSWRLANRLVGNPENNAALENLGGGLTFKALRPLTVAVTGAVGTVWIDGRGHMTNTVIHVERGASVTLGPAREGIRYYVAVGGGIDAEPVLGSRSYDTLGRLGPAPLSSSDVLYTGASPRTDPVVDHAPVPDETTVFAVMPGPNTTEHLLEQLLSRPWDLDPQSNRVGVRLSGPPIQTQSHTLPSRPMVQGAVQLPPNGLPIILGPDHPTTGGYPVIAVVTARSMSRVAQWSGGPRHFRRA